MKQFILGGVIIMICRRIICVFMCLMLFFSTTMPVFALEGSGGEVCINDTFTTLKGEFGTYFLEKTDTYNLVVGVLDNMIDCSIYYTSNPNTIYSAIKSVPEEFATATAYEIYEFTKKSILSGALILQETVPMIETGTTEINPMAVSNADRDTLLAHVYAKGHPSAHNRVMNGGGSRDGINYSIYRSLSYSVTEYNVWNISAGTTLSIVLALCGIIEAQTALTIASFALSVATGVYEVVKNTQIRKYNVYAYYKKEVFISGAIYSVANRTVKWYGYFGDDGSTIEFQYDNKDPYYDDHVELVNRVFENYGG